MHFKDGVKYDDDGRRVGAWGHRQFISSNGVTIYTVTFWADGTYSCNCPAWAFRKRCKHATAEAWPSGASISAPVAVKVALHPVKRVRRLMGDEE